MAKNNRTPDVAVRVSTNYGWDQTIAYKGVMCPDGIRRRARITSEPDTFFTIPASITVAGRTVKGFVSQYGDDRDMKFTVDCTGKNADVFYQYEEPKYQRLIDLVKSGLKPDAAWEIIDREYPRWLNGAPLLQAEIVNSR